MGMDLDLGSYQAKFEPPLSVKNPGEGLKVRPLCLEDYDRGFLQLLGQLTSVGDISREQWQQRWEEMKNCNSTYYVIVIEDTTVAGGLIIGQPPWSWRGSLSTAVAALVDWRMWWCLMSTEANSWASWWSAWPPCWQSSWAATR